MDGAESNVLLPEDELQAALAAIGEMSAEDAAAIPSLDDDREDTDGSAAEPTVSDSPLGEEELAAMVPEAEAVPSTADAAPASDDTAPNTSVEQAAPQESPETTAGAEAIDSDATAQVPQGKKKPRFKIGKPSSQEGVAEYRPPEGRGSAQAVGVAARPVTPPAKRVYRALDQALDRVNRPFERVGTGVRALVGWVALATLIVSILAIVLMPLVLPHRDAIVFLQEKRAQLDAPPPRPAEATSDEVVNQTP
jgi:hypothetical protein